MASISVVIVEDNPAWIDAARDKLGLLAPDIRVVGVETRGRPGVDLVLRLRPDVTLVDMKLPDDEQQATKSDIGGYTVIKEVRRQWSEARLLVFSTPHNYRRLNWPLQLVMQAGARGIVFKDTAPQDWVNAIRLVAQGGKYVPPHIQARLDDPKWLRLEFDQLPAFGKMCAAYLPRGYSNQEIAAALRRRGINKQHEHVRDALHGLYGQLNLNGDRVTLALIVSDMQSLGIWELPPEEPPA